MSKKNYTFTIEFEVMQEFKKLCREIDKPFSRVIEQMIEDWIEAQEDIEDAGKKI